MLLISDIAAQARYIVPAVPLAAIFAVVFAMVTNRQRSLMERLIAVLRRGWLLAFLLYLAAMLVSTLLARPLTYPRMYIWNHLWFRGIERWDSEIIENVIFFIPFAVLFLQAFCPRRPVIASLAMAAGTTMVIELGQLFFYLGAFQVSDILYNTLGGLIGCGIWCLIRRGKKREAEEPSAQSE